ncbi:MAG: hypothetical protein ABIQ07_05025 [Ginsengibacter sp.]
MKENLPFDDFVKGQFSDYSANVPAHIWENIAAKRKSRPKGFWMMFKGTNLLILSLVLLVGGGAFYLLLSTGKDKSSIKNISTEKNIPFSQTVNNLTEKNSSDKATTLSDQPTDVANQSPEAKDRSTEAEKNVTDIISDKAVISERSNQNYFLTHSQHKIEIKNANVIENTNTEINKEVTVTKLFSPFKLNNARDLSGIKILNSQNIKLPDCPTIEKNAAGNKQYWEVYAGPDRAFENYKNYGDTASNNYLQKRKASTRFASAFSAGVRYTKVFNNGTSVRAGVNYTQVNEKFLYFNPNEIKNVTVITTRIVIRAPGDTIYISDTLQYQQTGTRIKTTYNRYRNIDIPLVIGYELGNGRFHANINAGVIINVYSWYKGDVLDTLYQPVSITTGKGNSQYQFKNNIGIGFLGSVSVYYKMTDKLHLLLEPYFRYNLSPMSKANLNLQQKYHIAGLRAGLRIDLK